MTINKEPEIESFSSLITLAVGREELYVSM